MEINLKFTDDFIKKLKDKIPDHILDYGPIKDGYMDSGFGYIRFDKNILNSVYIFADSDSFGGNRESIFNHCTLKFAYVDNDFIFKNLYLFIERFNDNDRLEYRFDSDMNVVSKYEHYNGFNINIDDMGGQYVSKKIEDNRKSVDINYIYYPILKDFTDYFNFLEKNKIIENNDMLDNKCFYGVKEGLDVVALVLQKYKI